MFQYYYLIISQSNHFVFMHMFPYFYFSVNCFTLWYYSFSGHQCNSYLLRLCIQSNLATSKEESYQLLRNYIPFFEGGGGGFEKKIMDTYSRILFLTIRLFYCSFYLLYHLFWIIHCYLKFKKTFGVYWCFNIMLAF